MQGPLSCENISIYKKKTFPNFMDSVGFVRLSQNLYYCIRRKFSSDFDIMMVDGHHFVEKVR